MKVLAVAALVAGLLGQPSELDRVGLDALLHCESGGHQLHQTNTGNGFFGGVQWVQSTWDHAAVLAGHEAWSGVRPDLVPVWVQDEVTVWWWANSIPTSEWPVCSWEAINAMAAAPVPVGISFTG